jgi:hypothetical protein
MPLNIMQLKNQVKLHQEELVDLEKTETIKTLNTILSRQEAKTTASKI